MKAVVFHYNLLLKVAKSLDFSQGIFSIFRQQMEI